MDHNMRIVSSMYRRGDGFKKEPMLTPKSLDQQELSALHNTGILIVGDDETSLSLHSEILTMNGFRNITTLSSSLKAIDLIKSTIFSVIVADVALPQMDGIALLKIIRNLETSETTPVCMISETDDRDIINACSEWGADAVLIKPFNIEEFLEVVFQLLSDNQFKYH